MDSAKITLNQAAYSPHDTIAGTVEWSSSNKTTSFSLRLIYHTEGRGTQDIVVTDQHEWTVQPNSSGTESFQLPLPAAPYSFSGQLISLQWTIEVVALPEENFSIEQKFILSPTHTPLTLTKIENSQTGSKKRWWMGAKK